VVRTVPFLQLPLGMQHVAGFNSLIKPVSVSFDAAEIVKLVQIG
jgi:hypothetical protein